MEFVRRQRNRGGAHARLKIHRGLPWVTPQAAVVVVVVVVITGRLSAVAPPVSQLGRDREPRNSGVRS
jgi:hypothetical protein